MSKRKNTLYREKVQEFLPPAYTSTEEGGPDWFEVNHGQVARLLGSWGDPLLIPTLRDTIAQVWRLKQFVSHAQDPRIQTWVDYQDELAYALGQLDAFDALADLPVSASYQRVWKVNMAFGYLNTQEYYHPLCIALMSDMDFGKYQDLYQVLLQVLQHKGQLSSQEVISYLQSYGEDYFS